jgi:WD40 repeat protein
MLMSGRKDTSAAAPQDWVAQRALLAQELADSDFKTLQAYLDKNLPATDAAGGEYRCLNAGFAVTAIAFSADGRYLLAGGEGASDGTAASGDPYALRLWEVSTGEEVGRFRGHSSAVTCVAFAPRAAQAASASRNGTLHVWNTITRRPAVSFRRPESPVLSLAFSPDGLRLLTGGEDRVVRVWDLRSGDRLSRCEGHTAAVTAVAWFRDGRIASASLDRTVRVWDGPTGRQLHCWESHAGGVRSVAVSPDGGLVLSGGHDELLRLWDVQQGREAGGLPCPSRCAAVSFSPDGARALVGEGKGAVRLLDVRGRRELGCFRGHGKAVTSVAITPDASHAASGSLDQTVRVWTLPSAEK